jgi:hypothetical protein
MKPLTILEVGKDSLTPFLAGGINSWYQNSFTILYS